MKRRVVFMSDQFENQNLSVAVLLPCYTHHKEVLPPGTPLLPPDVRSKMV